MNPMVVSPPRREHVDGQTRVTVDVSDRAPLWFSVPDQFADLLGDRADHVLVALLMPAMKEGRDLHIGGTVTDSLLHQANNDLQHLLRMEHQDLQPIRGTADAASVPAAHASGVATASSGGVDSSAVLIEYFHSDDVPESLRVTHLLNNNVGAHGPDGDELWRVRCEPLRRLAADYGLPFVTVDSNLDAHYPLIGFLESVSMRNAAVAHLLSEGIGHLHVGSEISYVFARVDDSGEIARLDPMLLPLVSTTAVSVSSTSSGLSRVQRTIALIGRPEARYLDVCTDDDPTRVGNCSKCAKCVRAMLTLEIAGHLQDFCPDAFTYATYADHRDAYIARVLCRPTIRSSARSATSRPRRDGAGARRIAAVLRSGGCGSRRGGRGDGCCAGSGGGVRSRLRLADARSTRFVSLRSLNAPHGSFVSLRKAASLAQRPAWQHSRVVELRLADARSTRFVSLRSLNAPHGSFASLRLAPHGSIRRPFRLARKAAVAGR